MKAALITGGGSGIGLACARRLLADGCAVTLMGRSVDRVRAAAEELGTGATWVAGSVDREADVQRAVEATPGIDVAILAAGTGAGGPITMTSEADWSSTLATNLTGAFFTIKHAATAMAASGGGSIVGLSSIAGVRTHRFMTAYCVSKAGLEMLVANAADELGPMGIRVNSVRPGLVPTELSAGLANNQGIVDDYIEQMPVGRLGTTDDIAAAVRYLAGPESGWVTGVHLSVDGGMHLRRGPWLDRAT